MFFFYIGFHGDILKISDSVQANTARSQTLHRLTLRGGRLCTLLACAESENLIFKNPKLANTAQSQQLHFPKIQKWLTLHGVRLHVG